MFFRVYFLFMLLYPCCLLFMHFFLFIYVKRFEKESGGFVLMCCLPFSTFRLRRSDVRLTLHSNVVFFCILVSSLHYKAASKCDQLENTNATCDGRRVVRTYPSRAFYIKYKMQIKFLWHPSHMDLKPPFIIY